MCTHCPVNHSTTFNITMLHNLFINWGNDLSLKQLRAKLLALLCILGAFCMASASLPELKQVTITSNNDSHRALCEPVIGYKNNIYSNSKKVILHECSSSHCCPVHTFKAWVAKTCSLH
jgi:hypothetical protein